MKIKSGYLLRTIADTHIVVPIAERVIEFKGMMVLNDVSAKMWEFMQEDKTFDEVVEHILSIFDIDEATARDDIAVMLEQMEASGVLE